MREFARPATYVTASTGSLTDDVVERARADPDRPLFAVPSAEDSADDWRDVTAAQFHEQVRSVAHGLIRAGVRAGDRVVLLCSTRFEWTLLDYAIWFAGAVTVPLYESSPVDQVAAILRDCEPRAVVVETREHRDRVSRALELLPGVVPGVVVWCLDEDALDDLRSDEALGADDGSSLDPSDGSPDDPSDDPVEQRRSGLTPDSLATLVYTSGTTGEPKGCALTHGNFMAEVRATTADLEALFDEQASTLLFLPLPHVFARVVQVGAVHMGVRLAHSSDARRLLADLESFRPTFVLGVPRVFERLYNGASQRAAADGRGRLFDRASRTAISYSRALETGRPGPVLRARHAVFDRLVYAGLRDGLGGRCRYAIVGGAPLGDGLTHFFRGIGLTILEGYGLSETTAAVTVNSPDQLKIGTVGRPVGGSAVRVDEDGELCVRGGQVMAGYWNDEAATHEVLDEAGWLRTGDLGEIDDEGFVRVVGRKHEILVTAGGKPVAPSRLEDRIRQHPLVDQCIVVGDGRPFLAALVTLEPPALRQWAATSGRSEVLDLDDHELLEALHQDEEVRARVQGAVDDANTTVSQAEAVRAFDVLPREWTEDDGQLTPSNKVRRMAVLRQFRAEVDALYR